MWVPGYYRSIRYGMDDKWLYADGGVLWRRRARLPIGRVQMVNISQGPWQRVYGLATAGVHTAAMGQPTAELVYLNVANPEAIRDRILELVQRHRADVTGIDDAAIAESRAQASVSPTGPRPEQADEGRTDVARLLAGLLEEVRAIRAVLTERR